MKIICITLLMVGFSVAESSIYAQELKIQDKGDLIWSDEFDGNGEPDPTKWDRPEYNRRNNENGPDGWWSKEDSYLDGNGNLVIRVREIDNKNDDADSIDYSVGALRTKNKFEQLYGRFEIRCMLPTQPGWWVAFWMMQGDVSSVGSGGVDGTEVDIMEAFGWTNKINYAFHWDGYGDDHKSLGNPIYPAGIREGFHTFSLEWYPEMYVFFVDGEETWRSEGGGVCNQPGYIKVTGEISTEDWAINRYWAEHPAGAEYPDSFIVDYVRVYEIGEYESPASIKTNQSTRQINLYPNPARDQIMVHWDPATDDDLPDISILDIAGKTVKTFTQVQNNTGLLVDDLSSGIYCFSVQGEHTREYLKFIKN